MKIKSFIEDFYKSNQKLAILLVFILCMIILEYALSYFFYHIKTIRHLKESVSINTQRIKDMEEESHHQEDFNDEIMLRLGLLEGKFSVVEKLLYDSNRNRMVLYKKQARMFHVERFILSVNLFPSLRREPRGLKFFPVDNHFFVPLYINSGALILKIQFL